MKKEVGIAIKVTKQVARHAARPVRNTELYVTIMHQPVTVSSSTCSQTCVQIKHSLVHLQDLISILAGIRYISDITSQSRD